MNIIELNVDEIIPYENNPRKNEAAIDKVAASIKEFGFKVPIIVDSENVIVAGHTRLKAAEQLGLKTVPVIMADDLTEEQIKAFRIADNKTSELSEWDFERLYAEMSEIENIDMGQFGFDDLEKQIDDESSEREDIGITEEKYQLVIDCDDEDDMNEKYNQILEMGLECRILTL